MLIFKMTSIVEISDNEDSDDCVINSVVFVMDDQPESDLYHEVCRENQLLADFIDKCLRLENSKAMLNVLKEGLVKHYYEADKTARESPKFQKNLRRANYLLLTDPCHKFTHIRDLCNILKALKFKKRVPFVTLTTNLIGTNSKSNKLKKNNIDQLYVINGTSNKTKSCRDNFSSISENVDNSFNNTCDTLDETMSMDFCSQSSSVAEEDKLLIPKKATPVVPTFTEKRIKIIESKITCYKKIIAVLDEQEVDDDSMNSPYIKSERLKAKIVSLHKERCQLMGNHQVKHKGIHLKLAEGHPPGPTRVLERFLNKNCNKDGDPPFPDFCDVITCVTTANDKDNLGWTKAQIMNEATALFTLCGRMLQKRRQHREYRDLIYKIKLEDLQKDPAADDPELKAKLEENERIAVKKEFDILERYTMMQYLPTKSKPQKNATAIENKGNDIFVQTNVESDEQQEVNKNYNSMESLVCKASSTNEGENSHDTIAPIMVENSNMNIKPNSNADGCESGNINNNTLNSCVLHMDVDVEIVNNVDTKTNTVEGISKNAVHKKVISGADHKVKPITEVLNDDFVHRSISNKDNDAEKICMNVNENEFIQVERQIKQNADNNVMEFFKKLGDNFTVTIEVMNENDS